jgi:hypothetical protein
LLGTTATIMPNYQYTVSTTGGTGPVEDPYVYSVNQLDRSTGTFQTFTNLSITDLHQLCFEFPDDGEFHEIYFDASAKIYDQLTIQTGKYKLTCVDTHDIFRTSLNGYIVTRGNVVCYLYNMYLNGANSSASFI